MHEHESARCQKLLALLSEYLDGRLPRRTCRDLEAHMGDCAPCRAFLDSLKRVIGACREYQPPKLPPRIAARMRKALLAECERKPAGRQRKSRSRSCGA